MQEPSALPARKVDLIGVASGLGGADAMCAEAPVRLAAGGLESQLRSAGIDAADGAIEGPPYHCDINAMRALFPEPFWSWPKPPYPRTTHPRRLAELAVVLEHRG